MSERIKKLRKVLDLTQQKFADKLGVKRNTVGQWECGINRLTDQVIFSICREFDVNETWLRTGEGDIFVQRSPEDLFEYDGNGNAFYDAIIEMMKTYHSLDDKSKTVIREYFKNVADGIKNKEEKA